MPRDSLERARDDFDRAQTGDDSATLEALTLATIAVAEELREMNDRATDAAWINPPAKHARP